MKNKFRFKTTPNYISEDAPVDVKLSGKLEIWIQQKTLMIVFPLIQLFTFKKADDIEPFTEPESEKQQTNSLRDVNVFNTVLIFIALVFGTYSEILLADAVFLNSIKVSPEKAKIMAIGSAVILFAGAALIKRSLKRYLQTNIIPTRLFRVGIITSCIMLFTFGGLTFYNLNKKDNKEQIVMLNNQLIDARNTYDDSGDSDDQKEIKRLEISINQKLSSVNNMPAYIYGSGFFALSCMSIVMLFCSSFIKAMFFIFFNVCFLRFKKSYNRFKICMKINQYCSLQKRAEKIHRISLTYLRRVARQEAIENLIALNPKTSEYKTNLNKNGFSKNMRNMVVIAFIYLSFSFSAKAQENVFINIDKSISMSFTSEQKKHLKNVIKTNCKGSSAIFYIKFIGENTHSVSNLKIFEFTKPIFNESLYLKEDLAMQQSLHKSKINRKIRLLSKKILKFIENYIAKDRQTNILSSVAPLSRIKGKNIKVYYYTDGIESSRYRKLNVYPLKSEKQATTLAIEDAKKIRSTFQLPKKLSNVSKVKFIIPLEMGKKHGSDFIDMYLKEFYLQFGLNIEFNTL